jgi:acylaminoacyl-peptidase
MRFQLVAWCILAAQLGVAAERDDERFRLEDIFELEWATDPQISPDGERVVYVRNFMDVMKDVRRSNLWIVDAAGGNHRPLTTGNDNDTSPRWSPDGERLAYVSSADGSSQLYVRWMDTGMTAKLTNLTSAPSSVSWSPDGTKLAFSMFVPEDPKPFAVMPTKPDGAEWAAPVKVIQELEYRSDGRGYLKDGYYHLFVVRSDGGSPIQITDGDFNHRGAPAWTPDGRSLVFSANRNVDWRYEPGNSEIYEVSLDERTIRALTERKGPDDSPVVSPDGERIAYLGFDDRYQGYQVTKLYVMRRDGSEATELTPTLDRDASSPRFSQDSEGVWFTYDDQGDTTVALVPLDGEIRTAATRVGGTSLSRPYSGGSYSLAANGTIAFTISRADRPSDVAVTTSGGPARRLTDLNEDLFAHKQLGATEFFSAVSSHDGRAVQGWIVKPPGFDAARKYPLILEIHGGPFASYGEHFAAELQLYAAAGYVVVYVNPRGSTSYGEEFGNLIHHAYPGHDYDDLMSAVDAVIDQGYIDPNRLFVTGGSGGGVLTSWIVGKTDRFRAAVAAKPVINWYSFVLTADAYPFFYKYWFPGFPWDHPEHYLSRSPLSLVGNVSTPTMLLTGEQDHRTPISESEQYYQALKLRKVPSALVRVPGASHGIAARPSQLIAKIACILRWFEIYDSAAGSE